MDVKVIPSAYGDVIKIWCETKLLFQLAPSAVKNINFTISILCDTSALFFEHFQISNYCILNSYYRILNSEVSLQENGRLHFVQF